MKRKIFLGLNILVSLVFVWLATRGISFSAVWKTFAGVSITYALLSVLMNYISIWFRAWRWKYLMSPVRNVKVFPMFSSLMIGLMGNNILPFRVGEIMRCYVLKKDQNISFSSIVGTVVIERVLDAIAILGIFLISALFFPYPQWVQTGGYFLALALVVVIAVIAFILIKQETAIRILAKLFGWLPDRFLKKLIQSAEAFLHGVNLIHTLKTYLAIALTSLMIWVTYIMVVIFMFYAFDFVSLYNLGYFDGVVVMIFGAFAIMLPSAPGYFGTFHEMTKQGLTILGVLKNHALALAILFHAIHYIGITVLGLALFFKSNLSWYETLHDEKSSEELNVGDALLANK